MIRVEAEAISSTDDKYFCMEKLHKYIEGIEEQLEFAESENNAKEKARLLELKKYAQDIRQYIMKRPVGPKKIWFVRGIS